MSLAVPLSKRPRLVSDRLVRTIRRVVARPHVVVRDRLVHWDGADPRRCLEPDVFVKLGTIDAPKGAWNTWERGAPDVAFEILSPVDTPERWPLAEKLKRYLSLGVAELFVFDLEAKPGRRLRAWARKDWELPERDVTSDRVVSRALGAEIVVVETGPLATVLDVKKLPK